MHWPTNVLLAEGLMKVVTFRQLLMYAITGIVLMKIAEDKLAHVKTRMKEIKTVLKNESGKAAKYSYCMLQSTVIEVAKYSYCAGDR